MMQIKHNKQLKKIQLKRGMTGVQLSYLIASYFEIKQKVIGVMDKYGKFYQIDWICKNTNHIHPQPYNLLLQQKQATQSILSFTELSPNINTPIIHNLEFFQTLLTKQNLLTLVFFVRDDKDVPLPKPAEFFICPQQKYQGFYVYLKGKKVISGGLSQWSKVSKRIKSKQQQQKSYYSFQPLYKQQLNEHLKKLLKERQINQSQYLMLNQKLNHNPSSFCLQFKISQDADYLQFAPTVLNSLKMGKNTNLKQPFENHLFMKRAVSQYSITHQLAEQISKCTQLVNKLVKNKILDQQKALGKINKLVQMQDQDLYLFLQKYASNEIDEHILIQNMYQLIEQSQCKDRIQQKVPDFGSQQI